MQRIGQIMKLRASGIRAYQGTTMDPSWLAGAAPAATARRDASSIFRFNPWMGAGPGKTATQGPSLTQQKNATLGLSAQSSRINSDRARLGSLSKPGYNQNALNGPSGYTS